MRASEQRFRSLSASSPVGIFENDADGSCIYTNDRWAALSGLSFDESLGSGASAATHPEDRERCGSLLQRLDTGEIPVCKMEKRYVKKSGEWERSVTSFTSHAYVRVDASPPHMSAKTPARLPPWNGIHSSVRKIEPPEEP